MTYTPNKAASNARYEATLERLLVRLPRGEVTKAEIQAAADAAEESVNGYIVQAVRERMQRERANESAGGC